MISKFTTENNFKPRNSSQHAAQLQRHDKFDLESKFYGHPFKCPVLSSVLLINNNKYYIIWPLHKTAIFNFSRIYENASEYETTLRWSCVCFIFHLCNFMSSI